MLRRVDETAEIVGGEVIAGDPSRSWDRAAIDSRAVSGGELFFALPGERTDGHRFVEDAFARGAAAAVVHQDVALPGANGGGASGRGDGGCLLRVTDAYAALHDLTRALRRDAPEVLLAVTGSSGKTTTKELLGAMCARRFRTARSPGNLNNLYGFPVSFLSIPDDTEVMVAELGMSVAGELAAVSRLARPDGVVLTNVRPVHLESFPDLSGIAEAKAEIFEGLSQGNGGRGFVVANRDDPEVTRVTRRWREETGGRVVWFAGEPGGGAGEAEVRARDVRPRKGSIQGAEGSVGSRFVLKLGEEAIEVELPLHGAYNVANAVAAAAAARELGVTPEEIRDALAGAAPAAHRGAVHRLPEGVTLIDDSYNSNPDALARALAGAAELAPGRKVAVLGDMLELGPGGPAFHRESGEQAARLGFSPLAGVGELSRELVAGARESGADATWVPDAEAAAEWAEATLRPGDLVLVKGSRGVGLDRVVERILAAHAEEVG